MGKAQHCRSVGKGGGRDAHDGHRDMEAGYGQRYAEGAYALPGVS